jgi:hypothetical protein
VRLYRQEITTRLSCRFNFLAIRECYHARSSQPTTSAGYGTRDTLDRFATHPVLTRRAIFRSLPVQGRGLRIPGKYQTVDGGEGQSPRRFTPQDVDMTTKRQALCLQRRSRPEQSDQRQSNQAANISHLPRASRDSTSLVSRIEFPTITPAWALRLGRTCSKFTHLWESSQPGLINPTYGEGSANATSASPIGDFSRMLPPAAITTNCLPSEVR